MSDLLRAIQEAGADDLAAVNGRIESIEGELTSLRVLQRVLQAKLGCEPEPQPKKKREPKADAGGHDRPTANEMTNRRRAAAQYLIRHGATSGAKLASACGFDGLQVYTVLNHEWFTKSEQGYHITPAGRQACG